MPGVLASEPQPRMSSRTSTKFNNRSTVFVFDGFRQSGRPERGVACSGSTALGAVGAIHTLAQLVCVLVVVLIGGDTSVEVGQGDGFERVSLQGLEVLGMLALEQVGDFELCLVDRPLGKGHLVGIEKDLSAEMVGTAGVLRRLSCLKLRTCLSKVGLAKDKRGMRGGQLVVESRGLIGDMRQARLLCEFLHARQPIEQLLKMGECGVCVFKLCHGSSLHQVKPSASYPTRMAPHPGISQARGHHQSKLPGGFDYSLTPASCSARHLPSMRQRPWLLPWMLMG